MFSYRRSVFCFLSFGLLPSAGSLVFLSKMFHVLVFSWLKHSLKRSFTYYILVLCSRKRRAFSLWWSLFILAQKRCK